MSKDIINKVKGTRDFYPDQLAFRRWLYSRMQAVSEKYGYQEFDGPEIERIELYTEKTSEEIVRQQAFTLKDRDGKMLALRPEITPTFARMVALKADALLFPVRWYSFGRCWRYEQPQRGRGREFFQWEVNILGPETPEADAEILAMAVEFLKSVGLTADEVVIRINDRSFMEDTFKALGIPDRFFAAVLRAVDRKEKESEAEFASSLAEAGLDKRQIVGLQRFLSEADYSGSEWLMRLFSTLENYSDVTKFIKFDPIIVRGFDYYTRTVFEAWDKTGGLRRSLFGGGRFDNLTATLGGKRIPGVGMAPGDMPIEVLLRQFDKMPQLDSKVANVLVSVLAQVSLGESQKLADELRQAGICTELWIGDLTKLDKQLSYADKKAIPFVIILGSEEGSNCVAKIKRLSTGEQAEIKRGEVVEYLKTLQSKVVLGNEIQPY